MTKHPIQPIELDEHGTARFKRNNIIDRLFDEGMIDLNTIAIWAQQRGSSITQEDQMQLAQLLGYSVSGFGGLSYADPDVVEEADKQVEYLVRREKVAGCINQQQRKEA
jgi:hypothetical protein